MNPAIFLDTIVCWLWGHKKFSAVLGVAGLLAMLQVIPAPTVRGIPSVVNVTDFINNIRAACSSLQTTGTINASSTSMTVAANWDGKSGQGVAVLGAGASHGLSTPSAPLVIAQTQRQAIVEPNGNIWEAAVTFTASTSTDRLTTSSPLAIANGVGVKFSNQGGTLPTRVTTTAFVEGTTYYLRSFPEVQTIAISGTPTGGVYYIWNPDTKESVSVAYNANSATVQTALRTLTGFGSVTVSESGSTPNYTHTITFTGVNGNQSVLACNSWTLTGGTPAITVATTTDGGYKIYPTSGDAAADTNVYDIDGAGSGTHYCEIVGTTTYNYSIRALSGNGGSTTESSLGTTTIGNATLNGVTHNLLVWPEVSGANGYIIYDEDNNYPITVVSGKWTARVFVADAGGYTNLEIGDLGKTIVQGTHDGVVLGYDNPTRTIIIDPTDVETDTFPGGAAVSWSITSGTGAGTQTSAATKRLYYRDRGANVITTPYKRWIRRNNEEKYVGELVFHPASSAGQFYRVYKVFGDRKLASSAPSYTNTLGAFTIDGNVVLRRENTVYPTSPTGAAINDLHRSTIVAVSGTTVTLADAATTNVTSQNVFHDDTTAIQAWNNALGATGKPYTLFFPGPTPLLTGIVSGTGQDTRWGVGTGGANTQFALFNVTGRVTWKFDDNARLEWNPLDFVPTISQAGNEHELGLWRLSTSEPTIIGGQIICAPMGEPVFEKAERGSQSGYNRAAFLIVNSSTTNRITGPKFYGTEFHGWPRVYSSSDTRGYGQGEICRDCYFSYGGADGDNTFYTKGGVFDNCTVIGIRWTRSYTFYHDANVITQPLIVTGGYYKNIRKESIRFRSSDSYVGGGVIFEDCSRIYSTDSPSPVTINGAKLVRTSLALPGCDNVRLSNIMMEDGTLTVDSSNNNWLLENIFIRTPVGGSTLDTTQANSGLAITGGTNLQLTNVRVEAFHGTSYPELRAIQLTSGSDDISMSNCVFLGNRDWGVRLTAFTGRLQTTNTTFGSKGINGPDALDLSLGSTATWMSVNDRFEGTSTSTDVEFSGGGRMEFINPTFATVKLSVGTGVTGPLIIRGGTSTSSTAATIAEPNTQIYGHNFAVAPTLSGANLATADNKVAEALESSPAALSAGNNNDYPLGVTDTHRLDPNASNSVLTSIVARAGGTTVTIICVDAGAATITLLNDDGATGTAANRIVTPTGASIILSNNETVVLQYDITSLRWKVIGGGYSSIWNRNALQAWEGTLSLAA